MSKPQTLPAEATTCRKVVHHHHVALVDLAWMLGDEAMVNVSRYTEIARTGPEMVPYDEVVLELTDEAYVQQLLDAPTVPKGKRQLPRALPEQLVGCIEELDRIHEQMGKAHPGLIEKGRLTVQEAHTSRARVRTAADILRELLDMMPGQAELFEQAA